MDLATSNVRITAQLDSDGNFLSLQHSFSYSARLEDIKIIAISFKWAEVDAERSVEFFPGYKVPPPEPEPELTFFQRLLSAFHNFFARIWATLRQIFGFLS